MVDLLPRHHWRTARNPLLDTHLPTLIHAEAAVCVQRENGSPERLASCVWRVGAKGTFCAWKSGEGDGAEGEIVAIQWRNGLAEIV